MPCIIDGHVRIPQFYDAKFWLINKSSMFFDFQITLDIWKNKNKLHDGVDTGKLR